MLKDVLIIYLYISHHHNKIFWFSLSILRYLANLRRFSPFLQSILFLIYWFSPRLNPGICLSMRLRPTSVIQHNHFAQNTGQEHQLLGDHFDSNYGNKLSINCLGNVVARYIMMRVQFRVPFVIRLTSKQLFHMDLTFQ